jgi:hypothetical protein
VDERGEMSPSDLTGWQWMLCGVGVGIVAWIVAIAAHIAGADIDKNKLVQVPVGLISLVSAVLWIFGIIRYVKWVWNP